MKSCRTLVVLISLLISVTSFSYNDDGIFYSRLENAGYSKERISLVIDEMEKNASANPQTAVAYGATLYMAFQNAHVTECTRYGEFLLSYSFALLGAKMPGVALFYSLESEHFWAGRADTSQLNYILSLMRCLKSYIDAGDSPRGFEYLEKLRRIEYNGEYKNDISLALDDCEARLLFNTGKYELAENLFEKVQKANPKRNLVEKILYCKISAGKKDEVVSYIRANVDLDGDITTEGQAGLINMLTQIICEDKNQLSEAIRLQEKVVKYLKSTGNTLTTNYAVALSCLFSFLARAEETERAIDVANRAVNIFENLASKNVTEYVNLLIKVAPYLEENGYHELAKKYALKASELKFDYITYNMLAMPERRKQVWANEGKWYLSMFPSMTVANPTDDMLKMAYNSLLIGKGMLLNTERSISEIARKRGGEIKRLSDQLSEIENKLNTYHTYDEDSILHVKYTAVSNEFGRACYNDPSLNIYLNYTWEDVKKSLKDDEKAVEFFVTSEFVDEPIYNALILGRNDECPSLVRLCKVSELTSVPRTEIGEKLYNLVWKNIAPALAGTKKVYFSPDGILYQMPVEIPLKSLKGIDAIRLSSTRQLISGTDVRSLPHVADVFGGFKYGEHISVGSANAERAGMDDLPATKQEAETCAKLLNGASVATSSHIGLDGTEESFKKISGTNTNLIHIATHSKLMDNNFLEEISSDPLSQKDVEKLDMMNRAALMFTGANTTIKGGNFKEGTNDGILTAAEIAAMDLQDVDFAVLSACETAMGDVSGEGVFGLQRGFKKAGVKTIMMSLWKVDDNATMLIMNSFYKSWLSDKEHNSINALHDAQNAVKSFKGNINGKYQDFSDPKYWASFILLDAI